MTRRRGPLRVLGTLAVVCLVCAFSAAVQAKSGSTKSSGHASAQSAHGKHGYYRHGGGSKGKWSRARGSAPAAQAAPPPAVASPPSSAALAMQTPSIAGQALVPIAAGGVTSTSARIASDLASALDSNDLRILPMLTASSLQDAIGLAQADKADLAFLHSDLLATLSEVERPALASRIAFVARLYNEEVHLIAAREIDSVRDLNGKRVNVGPAGSANALTAELIFDRLGVTPQFVHVDQPTALAKLAGGEISADVLVSGRPVRALQEFTGDGHFRLLPIPYEAALQDIYLPAKIASTDYGNLVPPGSSVDTLAVGVVLATIDAPPGSARAARVARFTQALFDRFDALRDPARHPKWHDVNLAADVPGWTRFPAAREMLDRTNARSAQRDNDPSKQNGEPSQWRSDQPR